MTGQRDFIRSYRQKIFVMSDGVSVQYLTVQLEESVWTFALSRDEVGLRGTNSQLYFSIESSSSGMFRRSNEGKLHQVFDVRNETLHRYILSYPGIRVFLQQLYTRFRRFRCEELRNFEIFSTKHVPLTCSTNTYCTAIFEACPSFLRTDSRQTVRKLSGSLVPITSGNPMTLKEHKIDDTEKQGSRLIRSSASISNIMLYPG